MSDELLCRNTTYKHACDSRYLKRYNGYCLDCANAGVDERDEEIVRLRARIAELEALLCGARDACPCAQTFDVCAACRRINALVGLSPEDREKLDRLHAKVTEQRKTDGPWPEFTGDGK